MLDFFGPKVVHMTRKSKNDPENGSLLIYPEFLVGPSEDLMIKGRKFYAVWDEEVGMWSRDIETVRRLVDKALLEKRNQFPDDVEVSVKYLRNYSSKKWEEFLSYVGSLPDNFKHLDSQITFADTEVSKQDYVSRRLSYSMRQGPMDAYEEMISTLYEPIERKKIEWAIGAIISGDARYIEKMLVFYGQAGTGKGSILKVIKQLFQEYCGIFTAQKLCGREVGFALEMFKDNPRISIDFDGKLSNIEDNTSIDKVISHEELTIDSKHKSLYNESFETMLFVGTNNPVKITDSKSGITRRLIDVHPSGNIIPFARYQTIKAQVKFELGAIAHHCLTLYNKLGPDAYGGYVPVAMLGATNHFYNFIDDNYHVFCAEDGVTLKQVWLMYKAYVDEAEIRYPYEMAKVKEDLKGYFKNYAERKRMPDGTYRRHAYTNFLTEKFSYGYMERNNEPVSPEIAIQLEPQQSIFDSRFSQCKAQYGSDSVEHPLSKKWSNVRTVLSDLDTSELHYVIPPENHIVIDFDLKNEDGEKDLDLNLMEASKWPSTYTELSKSGKGVHLHYTYTGDPKLLATKYSDGVDILSFATGKALRRKLTHCNNLPVSTLSSGLPEKKGKADVIDFKGMENEKALRTLIKKNLKKEIHPGTKPSVDFIGKILDDAYSSGMVYDVTDMRNAILSFANNSSHHSLYCIKLVNKMHFRSEDEAVGKDWEDTDLVFYDVEVYPNLFVVCWKVRGEGNQVVKMINPTPSEIENLIRYRTIGFNNRNYDNHILYARMLGYDNYQLYVLSQKIISGSQNAKFLQAYNLSYTDIYDYCSAGEKKSLKKWQVELGIRHMEMDIPWDQPVPEDKWLLVAEYCSNDVLSTEQVFEATQGSWTARQILAELTGLTVGDTTNAHSKKFIFGNDKNPQKEFVYTDLSTIFPGYKYDAGISTYRGEVIGEGGLVRSEPGMYFNVPVLDAESMHPSSIIALNLFGDKYTARFKDLVDVRKAIKHKNYEKVKTMFDGKLAPYLKSDSLAKDLSNALKTVINSVYGLTSAKFDNVFRDIRNVDNIVAKRGALFMLDLKYEVEARGFTVAHIKTDSIKIPNATEEIMQFVKDYGKQFGYNFEHDDGSPYEKMCLVNDAVYIAKKNDGKWSAVGSQFAVPYVFKTLFSKEEVVFDDLIEVKNVTNPAAIYLDMNEDLTEGDHDYHFVGKAGSFVPIKEGYGGGRLLREKEGKYTSVTGTKDYRWLETEMALNLEKQEDVDMAYYDKLANEAIKAINKYGSFEEFVK